MNGVQWEVNLLLFIIVYGKHSLFKVSSAGGGWVLTRSGELGVQVFSSISYSGLLIRVALH